MSIYKKLAGWFLAALVLAGPRAAAATVYSNGFEAAAGVEWSSQKRAATPIGARHFLGPFGNDAVTLNLANLPAHTGIRVSFDFFMIQFWVGSTMYYGPHLWDFGVAGSPSLLHTTFSVNDDQPQAYPGNFPEVNNPGHTGATEIDTLGFDYPGDAVYHMSFDIYHNAPTVSLQFTGSHLVGLPATKWGLDNVTVETIAMARPAPASGTIVTNGDFETPIISDNNLTTYYATSTGITGWTVSNGSVDLNGSYWQNAAGRQSLDMSGLDSAGTIYQDLNTVPGKSYKLAFSLAGNGDSEPVKKLEVWWNGARVDTAVFNTTGKSYTNMGWVRKNYLVSTPPEATGTTRLMFVSDNPGSFGPALDLVSVVPANPGDLIQNGEFEFPTVAGAPVGYGASETLDRWTVADGSVQQVGADWQTNGGKQSVHLNGNSAGKLTQSVPTTAGASYLLRFSMAGDPDGGPAVKQMAVTWGNSMLETQSFDSTGRTNADMGWSHRAYLVKAGGATTELSFQSLTRGVYGPVLDSVSLVPAVPGDANLDGVVTIADGVLAMRQVTGADATDPAVTALCDLIQPLGTGGQAHGSGLLTMSDAIAVVRLAGGLS